MIRIAIVEDDTAARTAMRAHLDRFAAEAGRTFEVKEFSDAGMQKRIVWLTVL